MPPVEHTRAIMHSCGAFVMCPPASGLERLSDSERVQSHDGISSATAVLSLDGSSWRLPVRKIIMPSRRPIAKRLGTRGLDGRRDVARSCFTPSGLPQRLPLPLRKARLPDAGAAVSDPRTG